ncbi:hypothetical protein QOZ80_8AG0620760 [Eleusine coracana subsp. coracana]|nr:hypothetical protein QOZ80_8AG0620760 [Eleusine coracana subsp. coracana]
MSAIVTSMNQSLIMSLEHHQTAKEMWDYLQQRYVHDNGAHLHNLMQGLCGLSATRSLDEYYTYFERLMGPVLWKVPSSTVDHVGCANKNKFIEKFLMYQFVMGQRSEFEPVRVQVLNQPTVPSIAEVLSSLIAEETCLCSLAAAASSTTTPYSVLAAPPRTIATRGSSSETKPCDHCGKTTHLSENCFTKHPKKLAEFRARRAGCGHGIATVSRGSAAVAASQVGASQSSWALDSEASFHVTSDQSQLVDCKPVIDGSFI